ncbi:SBP (S-ribonuclease binding protein) family protein [Striga asiatica]|uniref:SBP (S-ribonuclease binding protein) family protein n=1 Tax=Striga asiatica TaxID=4170 RepID=A0A5A7PT12_STRAF|nr:SBP (S-ribonuclease binding protein) family protein [Striga asiatica]
MAIQAQLYSENFVLGPQDMLMMENGYGLDNFSLVPQCQQQTVTMMQFDRKNMEFLAQNNDNGNQFLQPIAKQSIEFEQWIHLQSERLRLGIENQMKLQMSSLLEKFESRARFLLAQKDGEIARASGKTAELEDLLRRLQIESLTWQRIAAENESVVASLDVAIQRLRESASAEDAASCCHDGGNESEERGGDAAGFGMCRACGLRGSRVVILPCRHVCSCVECEVFLDNCPVCRMVKKGSIEALI